MIFVDTSSMVAYFQGDTGDDIDAIERALLDRTFRVAPVVLTELLSDPKLDLHGQQQILAIVVQPVMDGFWQRAGITRRKVLQKKRKARLGDVLVAQAAIDQKAPLICRDVDFSAYVAFGLKLWK